MSDGEAAGIMIIFVLFWLFLCFVPASIADKKGRSAFGFFLLSLILSPLIGLLAALVVSSDPVKLEKQKEGARETKNCPFCAEQIKAEAIVCRYCGKDVPPND